MVILGVYNKKSKKDFYLFLLTFYYITDKKEMKKSITTPNQSQKLYLRVFLLF